MKILVDEMPTKVGDCPWSSPIKDPCKDRTFSAIFKARPSKIIKIFWGTKLKWYQALWLDLIFYWEKGEKRVFKRRT